MASDGTAMRTTPADGSGSFRTPGRGLSSHLSPPEAQRGGELRTRPSAPSTAHGIATGEGGAPCGALQRR